MSQSQAKQDALNLAMAQLKNVDISKRVTNIGLPAPEQEKLILSILGRTHVLDLNNWDLTLQETHEPAVIVDKLFLLHYLLIDVPFVPSDEWVTYRSFPGGAFYWPSYLTRSTKPLLKSIGNDIERLQKQLDRLECRPVESGDLGTDIHVLGRLWMRLIYYQGDEEFQPELTLLYDRNLIHRYPSEDITALASRVCFMLMEN